MVTSAKMQKTIVVKVTAHDAASALSPRRAVGERNITRMMKAGEARVGDTVRIVSTRPLSKLKRWRLKEVLQRSTRVA